MQRILEGRAGTSPAPTARKSTGTRSDLLFGRGLEFLQDSGFDHFADPLHPVQVEVDVVEGQQHRRRKILQDEEIPQVGAAVPTADGAAAIRIEGRQVLLEAFVFDRDLAPARVDVPHPAVASREDAVEEIAARAYGGDEVRWRADAHEITWLAFRKEPGRQRGGRANRLLGFPDSHAADRVSRKGEIEKRRRRPPAQVLVRSSLKDAEEKSSAPVSAAGPPGPVLR